MTAGLLVDQTEWGKLRLGGADRKRFLQGMITNDLDALPLWPFVRAAVLTPKGRVIAVCDVVDEGETYLLISEPACADKLRATLEKHAIMDDVTFTPVLLPCYRVWGDPWTAAPVLEPPPGETASEEEVEILRIEAGLPRYGADVTEDYFPFEANLDSAISYKKGCYVGQEVVARANARGHANKRLVGLRLSGEEPAAPGTLISAAVRPEAGTVTSSIVSPRLGPIALGYLHRSVWEPGTQVQIGERGATVTPLPFAG